MSNKAWSWQRRDGDFIALCDGKEQILAPAYDHMVGRTVVIISPEDAALVAAAPCLLAACKALLHASNDKRYSAKEAIEAREAMEAAIAKAEGQDA